MHQVARYWSHRNPLILCFMRMVCRRTVSVCNNKNIIDQQRKVAHRKRYHSIES